MSNYKQYLKTKSTKTGKGVFTTVKIPANMPIIEMKGDIFIDKPGHLDHAQVLQVGPNTFLGPSGEVDDYINHSCDPNCYMHVVGNRAILYSLYVIPANSELTFDYSLTANNEKEDWTMACNCGSNKCRKEISGFQHLSPELQDEYKKKKMVPLYLTSTMIMKK
jgi:hypothetical protein